MRWLGRIALVSIALAFSNSCLAAGEPYAFNFQDGKELKYRRLFRSDGQFVLPDGKAQPMKMQAISQVVLKMVGKAADGFSIESQTLRSKATMNGKDAPTPKDTGGKRTFTLKPTGAITGEAGDMNFGVVFPDKPLAKGDSFTMERAGEQVKGPATKTTFTLVETDAKLAGYPNPVAVFDARIALSASPKEKKIALKTGEGKLWFDRASGVLVRSKMGLSFDEESTLPGAKSPQTMTYSMHSDWELVTK